MSELSDKYFSKNELIGIARENKIAENYIEAFISFIEKDIQELVDENGSTEDEFKKYDLSFAINYFNLFDIELKKGHSEAWASVYARVFGCEGLEQAFYQSYLHVKSIDPQKAIDELKIHCRSINADELYIKRFIYLIQNTEALNNPDQQAATYSKIYKAQITQGKSAIFAHHYADSMASKVYTELACFAEASEYEQAIAAGHSKAFAASYSIKISEFIGNKYVTYAEALEDDFYKEEKARLFEIYKHLN